MTRQPRSPLYPSIAAVAGLTALLLLPPALGATEMPPILCPDVAEAEAGDMLDAYLLGKAYDEGYCNVAKSKVDAEHWYRVSAQGGHTLAAYELGETFFTGDGLPIDYPEAKKWYQAAAEKGHGMSQLRMGFLTAEAHFEGLTTDYTQAEEWFIKAADQDAGDARFRLGNFYNNYKQPPDYGKGFIWLLKASEGGHKTAMFDLARMLLDGKGVAQNTALGMSWLEKSAKGDILQSQMTLADIYGNGKYGVPKDARKALIWILKIANKPTASIPYLNKAGDIFFEGRDGMPKNYPTALKYYTRAAAKDDAHAKERLAQMYREGLGVAVDEKKAEEYSR